MISFVDTTLRCPSAGDDCALGQRKKDGRGRTLTEHQRQVDVKSTDHVHRPLRRIGRAAQALAVDGDLPAQRGDDTADPAAERGFELLGIDQTEDAQKRVLRGHAVGQHEKAVQPRLLDRGPFGDVLDRVAVGQHGTHCHHQNLLKVMPRAVAGPARVGHLLQRAHQIESIRGAHFVRPKGESGRDFGRAHERFSQVHEYERQPEIQISVGMFWKGDDIRVRQPWGRGGSC